MDVVSRGSRYTPSYAVARSLGLNPLVLSKTTSSFSVMVDDQRVNLGLNLKFEAKKLKVLGYSRRSDNGWEFSEKAIQLLREYMDKFPEFFAGIMRNPQGDIYTDTDFYDPSESRARIKEISGWLKSIESKNFEKVPLEAQQLEAEAVKAIEEAANGYMETMSLPDFKRVKNVPRKALLKPEDAEHRLHDQRFDLGDRVVYVQSSGKVPIATRGTVIGLTKTARHTLLDVVFDVTFMSGSTLGDRCSAFRGMTVPASSVLNLTSRQLVAITKAGSANEIALNGQLRPAQAPARLTSGYNTAAGGGGGRGRGRANFNSAPQNGDGGGARGGARGNFTPRGPINMALRGGAPAILQRPKSVSNTPSSSMRTNQAESAGNAQQMLPYNQMPPPEILNRRGTPRGGGRGRGSRGRGLARGRGGSPAPAQTLSQ